MMKKLQALRRTVLAFSTVLLLSALGSSSASADWEIKSFAGGAFNQDGTTYSQALGHPYQSTTDFTLSPSVEGQFKDVVVDLPPGFIANPLATPSVCTTDRLANLVEGQVRYECPNSSQVGTATLHAEFAPGFVIPVGPVPVFNMKAPAGMPGDLAFDFQSITTIHIKPTLRTDGDYGISASSIDSPQTLPLIGVKVTVWGNPRDPSHDVERECPGAPQGTYGCTFDAPATTPVPFVTNPGNCSAGAQPTIIHVTSYLAPNVVKDAFFDTDTNGNPTAVENCAAAPFAPLIDAEQTTDQAQTPSGLKFHLDMPTKGLLSPSGIAEAHIKRAEVRLPVGTTLNPSAGEGLGFCSTADLARETPGSEPGSGCPNQSKLGTVSIESPLLEKPLGGSVYLAQPDDPAAPGAENPFDSLIAMYVVAKSEERGLAIKLPGKVETDPVTGRVTTIFDDLPQLPVSGFDLNLREGARAPLVSPSACGTYVTEADFIPWSASDPDDPAPSEVVQTKSKLQVTRGVGGGPCPSGGLPPFKPGLMAGTRSNSAGSYSPFDLRLTRQDGEQEFTNFSIKLPPGVTGKLAGLSYCPDAAIEAAKLRSGTEELAVPSCPQGSEVGRTLVGAGVGSLQAYIPGKVYLAGPYNGSNISIVAITSAKTGPFDLGTVVVREALRIDRRTAEVSIDPTGSDPLPRIIDGVTTHLRDIRAYVDRPEFVLNPTGCDPTSTASTVLGSGLDFANPADDLPVTVATRFQAANCAALPFKPSLKLSVSGSTKRAGNPAFKAVYTATPGHANLARAEVTLPGSEFLDNAHIRTVCTRVQYAAEQCPAGSIYGRARAITPILDQPVEGPVYLRSNPEHELPDLVARLKNAQVDFDLVGRVDSVGKGRIRNTFEGTPDVPVSKFVLEMAGGNKGLLENSANLCKDKRRAIVKLDGHNGKVRDFKAKVKPKSCGKKKRKR